MDYTIRKNICQQEVKTRAKTKVTESTPEVAKEGFQNAAKKREEEAAKKEAERMEAERAYLNDPDRAIEVLEKARLLQKNHAVFRQDAFVQVVARVPVKEGASVQQALTGDRGEDGRACAFLLGMVCMAAAMVLYCLVKGGVL